MFSEGLGLSFAIVLKKKSSCHDHTLANNSEQYQHTKGADLGCVNFLLNDH